MKTLLTVLLMLTPALLVMPNSALCHSIHDVVLTPTSPESMDFNQDVNVAFNYDTGETGGVRIWARPLTNGALTPNYAASGSVLYPMGMGSGDGHFTISSGAVIVDQVRLQMWDDGQTTLLAETIVDVNYSFSSPNNSITSINATPPWPALMDFNQDVDVTFDYETDEAAGVRIFARPMTGGALTPSYAAQGSPVYPFGSSSGSCYFTITSGAVVVDQIRLQMWNLDQTVLLVEVLVDANYSFSSPNNAITNVVLAPPPPAARDFNEQVTATFDYETDEVGGVRIFMRPLTGGSTTPHYAAHGSPSHPVGLGSGTGYFTITQDYAVVEQVRFQMWNDAQTVLLFEMIIDAEYTFGNPTPNVDSSWGNVKTMFR